MMNGVFFGNKHSFRDFGLVLQSRNIPLPVPKTHLIDIPGGDGQLDLTTSLTGGKVKYQNRPITMNFTTLKPWKDQETMKSVLGNLLHGRVQHIRFECDPDWYWVGRCVVETADTNSDGSNSIVIKADCKPYKFDVLDSTQRKEWKLYGSDVTKICNMDRVQIVGSGTITVPAQQMDVVPIITVSEQMTLQKGEGGKQHTLFQGDNIIPDVMFSDSDTTLNFTGTGTVTILFRQGAL